jgi:hypothetical protein
LLNQDNSEQSAKKVISSLLTFLEATQKHLFRRTQNQERWEVQPSAWMTDPSLQDSLQKDLTTLGFISEISPHRSPVDGVIIFGATGQRIQTRMQFLKEKFELGFLASTIYSLSGERYLVLPIDLNSPTVDGSLNELKAVQRFRKVKDLTLLTENDLMHYYTHTFKLDKIKPPFEHSDFAVPVVFINTPKNDLPRPTTQTTLNDLIEHLAKQTQKPQSLTFVSNQPYVAYQEALARWVFYQAALKPSLTWIKDIKIEVTGSKTDQETTLSDVIEGLGSAIWAKGPMVMVTLCKSDKRFCVIPKSLEEKWVKLYKTTPLVFEQPPFTPEKKLR